MNILYIVAILLQVGIIIYFIRRNKIQAGKSAGSSQTPAGDSYDSLRALSLSVTPGQLKLTIPGSETLVYGIVMDWNIGDMLITVAAYITGASNMYLSNGENIKGGGNDVSVGEMAVDFVVEAQNYVGRAIPVPVADFPAKECIRFHLLTNRGIFSAQEQALFFEDASSPWLPLFEKGGMLMSEMRASGNGAVNQN